MIPACIGQPTTVGSIRGLRSHGRFGHESIPREYSGLDSVERLEGGWKYHRRHLAAMILYST